MDGRTYRVIVSNNGCSPATSNGLATLTVNTAPAISAAPADVTICSGSNATFSATATGTNLTYQWQENSGSGFVDLSNGGVYGDVTTATLALTNVPVSMDGRTYRVIVSNRGCTSATSNGLATLTVNTAPAISAAPADVTICSGSNTSFSATATGTNLTYQWQENSGSGFVNLSNGGVYGDVTTATLALTNVPVAVNGRTYRVIVSNAGCTSATSNGLATLTVNTAPAISTAPANATICSGSNTSFSVTATGTNLTYQWQEDNGSGFVNLSNGGVYGGVTTATLALTNVPVSMTSNRYRVVVSNSGCTSATSNGLATLTVNTAPAISAAPTDVTICSGSNTTFSATATGTNLTYQWQEDSGSGFVNLSNGGVYSGVTTATLALTNVPVSMTSNRYRVIVSNTGCTSATSNGLATLTVNTA
ncbi:MAG: hypothetical protein O9262_13915, partial [Cyclobacteriaceae bacterium]|nr:hypothetical protein [Cyclobacteriaceae bacterium]